MRKKGSGHIDPLMFDWFKRIFRRSVVTADSRGETGERLAADFLRRERNFTLVARNWRSPRDRRAEIDLVCRDGEALVFVEVKTRLAGVLVPGFYAVDRRKKRALLRACNAYLGLLAVQPVTIRFDIVDVALPADGREGAPEVRHFANIPLFPKRHRG
jgi:putative endonuclease